MTEKQRYIIMQHEHTFGLSKEVNDMIKIGYEPIGGVMVVDYDSKEMPTFYQEMVLKLRPLPF